MSDLSEIETQELRRVLASFKAGLPSHALGDWYITKTPHASVIEMPYREGIGVAIRPHGDVRIEGHTECIRCGKRFEIPRIGNFAAYNETVDETVERAKIWVADLADKDGPCWGDVPKPVMPRSSVRPADV